MEKLNSHDKAFVRALYRNIKARGGGIKKFGKTILFSMNGKVVRKIEL
jgi:hypothetical protein